MGGELRVGDRVRVRYGSRAGEVATITNLTWHANRFGAYVRVEVSFEDGACEARGADSLERVEGGPDERAAGAGQ